MKAGLISGRKLSRAWRDMREQQMLAGPGWLSRGGPRGQTFHQQVFRIGLQRPDNWDELTDEEQAAYDAVNFHRADMLSGLGGSCAMSATPANCIPPRTWPSSRPMLISQRTQRAFAAAAMQSEVSCIEGMQASASPQGVKLVRRPGPSGSGGVMRRTAIPARHPRADGAGMLRRHRAIPVSAGSDLTRRGSTMGNVVSGREHVTPLLHVALTTESGSEQGVGSGAVAYWGGEDDVVIEADVVMTSVLDNFQYGARFATYGRRASIGIEPMRYGVTLRHQTPDIDELLTYTANPSYPSDLDLADPFTWTPVIHLTLRGTSTQDFEQITVSHVWWS